MPRAARDSIGVGICTVLGHPLLDPAGDPQVYFPGRLPLATGARCAVHLGPWFSARSGRDRNCGSRVGAAPSPAPSPERPLRLPTGLHQRPAAVPAVLPGLRPLHPAHPEPHRHRLSLQEAGPAAQVSRTWRPVWGMGAGTVRTALAPPELTRCWVPRRAPSRAGLLPEGHTGSPQTWPLALGSCLANPGRMSDVSRHV